MMKHKMISYDVINFDITVCNKFRYYTLFESWYGLKLVQKCLVSVCSDNHISIMRLILQCVVNFDIMM